MAIDFKRKLLLRKVTAVMEANNIELLFPEKLQNKLTEDIIDVLISEKDVSYSAGVKNAIQDDNLYEFVKIYYSVEAFKECQTMEDFKEKYLEIERRSFNLEPWG